MPCLAPSSFSVSSRPIGPLRHAVDALGDAALKVDGDLLRLVGRSLRADRPLVHGLFRLVPGVLQQAALVAQVPQVAVAAVDRLLGGGDGHIVLGGVVQGVLAAADGPLAPRGDDAQPRVERHDGQLEAHLVVALAGAAVRDGVSALQLGDLDHALGDQRPGDAGAQQVLALVDRAGLHHGVEVVGDELLAQVFDVDLAGAGGEGLLLQAAQFLALAQVGREADHLAAVVVAQPGHDNGGIQPAGVGEHDFFDGLCWHEWVLGEVDRWGD